MQLTTKTIMKNSHILLSVMLISWKLFVFAQFPPYPQGSATLDANDMAVGINIGGDISWDLIGDPRFEVPKGSGNHALFAGNLWIGAIDDGGQLRMTANTYRQSGVDIWPGPVATGGVYDSTYFARYGNIWKVSAQEVQDHQANFAQPGYLMPQVIETWPGNGDTTNGEAWLLAPFVDVNANTVYEPQMGDYPDIPGDQATYQIFSDIQFFNTETLGEPTGLDMHQLAYVYDVDSASVIDRTVFFSYKLINRTQSFLNELYIGLWFDFGLGFPNDDNTGCDTLLNTFYSYNGDATDIQYGATPPVMGAVFLNQKMDYYISYSNNFGTYGNPETAQDYYGYLQNFWKNGDEMTFGGNGTNGIIPTNYLYPGDPNDLTQWSEQTITGAGSDKRGIGSSGPYTLLPEEVLCFDYALVFARAASGNHLSSVAEYKAQVPNVKSFYLANPQGCDRLGIVSIDEEVSALPFTVSPNPFSDEIHIQLDGSQVELQVHDVQGKVLLSESMEGYAQKTLNMGTYAKGLYFLTLRKGNQVKSWKLVKQ